MKKVLVAVAAILASVSAHAAATGQLILSNRGTGLSVPIKLTGGPKDGSLADATYAAQLFLVSGGSETALTPVTTFRSGAAAGFLNNATISIPNFGDASGPATFRIKAFDVGTSFDTAITYHGVSPDFTATVNVAPTPPTATSAFPSFTLVPVPEPSTIALAALGGAALLFRRRK